MPILNQTCVEVSLEALRCEAIIGIYPYERRQTQPLTLDLTLSLDAARYWRCAALGDLNSSVNYATLRSISLFLAQEGHFRLLETLTSTLARAVFFHAEQPSPGLISALTVKASKPEVFEDGSRPSVSLAVQPDQLPPLPSLTSAPQVSWETRSVEITASQEPSTAPKRLSQGPAELSPLCVSPELKVFGLRAHAQQLSALSIGPSSATLLLTGKWYGVRSSAASSPPKALQQGQAVGASEYQELWCLEGGSAITLTRGQG